MEDAKWWGDSTLTLQRLWDHGQLGNVVEFLDFQTVGYMVVPAIMNGDLSTLNKLTSEAMECHETNIMRYVVQFRSVPVLKLMIAKGISSAHHIEDAVEANWIEGLELLFDNAVAKHGVVNCDCALILDCLEERQYEIVHFGIVNNWELPDEWYEHHNQGYDLVGRNQTNLADMINQAFHMRIRDDMNHKRAIDAAWQAFKEAKRDCLLLGLYSRTPDQHAARLTTFREAWQKLAALGEDPTDLNDFRDL